MNNSLKYYSVTLTVSILCWWGLYNLYQQYPPQTLFFGLSAGFLITLGMVMATFRVDAWSPVRIVNRKIELPYGYGAVVEWLVLVTPMVNISYVIGSMFGYIVVVLGSRNSV